MKEKGNDQLPQICFLVSGSGVLMSSVFAGRQGKQSACPLYQPPDRPYDCTPLSLRNQVKNTWPFGTIFYCEIISCPHFI